MIRAAALCLALLSLARPAAGQEDDDPMAALRAADADWNARRGAALALARRGESAVEPLLEALLDASPEVELAARVGLSRIGRPALTALRGRLAGAETSEERIRVARAIGDFGATALEASADLDRLLDADQPEVARTARKALLAIGRAFAFEPDRVTKDDGTVVEGLVVESDEEWVGVDVIQRTETGPRVFHTRLARARIERIASVEDRFRPLLRARVAAYREAGKGVESFLSGLRVEQAGDGLHRVQTEHFRILSSAPARFLREAAYRMEAMAASYEDVFAAPVAPASRVEVRIAGSLEEYVALQEEIFGASIQNPAFYVPTMNAIFGWTDIESWQTQIETLSGQHAELTEAIEKAQRELRATRLRLSKEIKELRAALEAEARQLRKDNRSLPSSERREANARVDRWLAAELERIDGIEDGMKASERDLQESLTADRQKIQRIEVHNRNLLDEVGRRMFETLHHEAFHAFFRNRVVLPEHTETNVRWLNEGLAMYFEAATFDGSTLVPGQPNADWIRFLQDKQASGGLFDLATLFGGTGADFLVHGEDQTDRSQTFYYQSWYLVRLLMEQGKLADPIALRYYVAEIAAGVDPTEAFESLVLVEAGDVWNLYQSHLRSDDAERYQWMRFGAGSSGPTVSPALARITMRVNGKVHVRLRTGETHVVGEGEVEVDERRP